MALGAGAATMRWGIMAQTADVTTLALIEPLHGLTFALFHLAGAPRGHNAQATNNVESVTVRRAMKPVKIKRFLDIGLEPMRVARRSHTSPQRWANAHNGLMFRE